MLENGYGFFLANGVIRKGNLRRILFDTVFSKQDHQHFASHGFQAKDIHGMARTFSLDPYPGISDEPEETNSDQLL